MSKKPLPPQNHPNPPETPGESVEAPHLDAIDVSEPNQPAPDQEVIPPNGDQAQNAASGLLTADQFFTGFKMTFQLAGTFTTLQSLPIYGNEEQAARGASDAIYATALETPFLRFLIEPSNLWIQRSMVVFAFVGPKVAAVRSEIAARKNPPKQSAQEHANHA